MKDSNNAINQKNHLPNENGLGFLFFLGLILLNSSCALELIGSDTGAEVGSGSGSGSGGPATCSALISNTLTVEELYPTYDRWNDYVQRADPTVACSGADVGAGNHLKCIHAGERRKVNLPGAVTSCDGLTAADDLGAFDWACDDSGSPVYFYSYRLKSDKGLADLIEPTAGTSFLSNTVTITDEDDCDLYQTTSSSTWWTNTISVLPNLSTATAFQTLASAYTIYTVPEGSNASTNGYDLNADGIAVVTLGDEVLTFYGAAGATFNTLRVMLLVNSNHFAWIEGKFNGGPAVLANRAEGAIGLNASNFSRVHKTIIQNTDEVGIIALGTLNSLFTNIGIENVAIVSAFGNPEGMSIWSGCHHNTFHNIRIANVVDGHGVGEFGQYNIWNRVNISNVNGVGFNLYSCCGLQDTVITEAVISGTQQGAMGIGGAATIGFTTLLNAQGSGLGALALLGQDYNTLFQILGMVSPDDLIKSHAGGGAPVGNQIHRIASVLVSEHIHLQPAMVGNDDNRVENGLWLDSTDCTDNGTGPLGNWFDNACNYGSATPAIPPDSTTLTLEGRVLGRVASDSTSPHAAQTAYTMITDWLSLDSFYRGWGKVNTGEASELHTAHAGYCASGQTCNIYDVRFGSTASQITHLAGTFSDSACPSSADSTTASNVITDGSLTSRTFLLNAAEIMFDEVGNDNGLCESNEHCIFAPHIGAYLGEGDYESSGYCDYAGGNGVTNYRVFGYPTTEASE